MGQNGAEMAEKMEVAGSRRPVAGAGESSGELEVEGAWGARGPVPRQARGGACHVRKLF